MNNFVTGNIQFLSSSCHGCSGRGWVETSDYKAHKCPVCDGQGIYSKPNEVTPLYPPMYPSVPVQPTFPWQPQYPYGTIIVSSSGTKFDPNLFGASDSKIMLNGNSNQMTIASSKLLENILHGSR